MPIVHLINAKQAYAHSQGNYTQGLHDAAVAVFKANNWTVTETNIEAGYDDAEALAMLNEADLIISHTALWWMGLPWKFKRYIDEVITAGHGSLYNSDGRTRSDQGKLYGSGGLKTTTKYMLCMLMNAPESAFSEAEAFFEGNSVDGAQIAFHKTFQFLGMEPVKTFVAHDVMKEPRFEEHKAAYVDHLQTLIASF